jgi:hypothetical protein
MLQHTEVAKETNFPLAEIAENLFCGTSQQSFCTKRYLKEACKIILQGLNQSTSSCISRKMSMGDNCCHLYVFTAKIVVMIGKNSAHLLWKN